MKTVIISRTLEVVLLLLIYFGAYLGNSYAENLMLAMAWIPSIFVSLIFVLYFFASAENKDKFILDRKPKSTISKLYSSVYDALVFCLLFQAGYVITACFWTFTQFLAVYTISSIDNRKKAPAL
jgi:amino acid transporter